MSELTREQVAEHAAAHNRKYPNGNLIVQLATQLLATMDALTHQRTDDAALVALWDAAARIQYSDKVLRDALNKTRAWRESRDAS